MKKTRAFIVNSKDIFDTKKNPKASLSVSDTMRNPQIEKRCLTCGNPLVMAAVYEHGQEDESLYCSTCLEDPI